MTVTIEVEAIFDSGKVVIPSRVDVDVFFQSGYGTLHKDQGLILSRCEALYLIAEKRVKLVEATDKTEVTFQSVLDKFRTEDPEIWTRYLIFRDLRSRGYVVKDGIGQGIDFRVYERGTYRKKVAKYVVFSVCEGNPISVRRLGAVLRLVQNMKKELVVAVIDRRGEIVYYSISWLNLRSESGE